MSDPTSVFDNDKDTSVVDPAKPAESTTEPSVSAESLFTDHLAAIRNERGEQKYDSVQKALEGLKHSQEFIPQLKAQIEAQEKELALLREAKSKQESVEDVVARLTASQANANTTESGLDEQKAAALFEQMLKEAKTKESLAANQTLVQNELVTQFGSAEAANKVVVAKAKELGTTAEEIGKLSAQNPKMVLELFKSVSGRVESSAPPTPSVNSDGLLGQKREDAGLQRPEKSLLAGATYKEQLAYLEKIRENVYKKYDITK